MTHPDRIYQAKISDIEAKLRELSSHNRALQEELLQWRQTKDESQSVDHVRCLKKIERNAEKKRGLVNYYIYFS